MSDTEKEVVEEKPDSVIERESEEEELSDKEETGEANKESDEDDKNEEEKGSSSSEEKSEEEGEKDEEKSEEGEGENDEDDKSDGEKEASEEGAGKRKSSEGGGESDAKDVELEEKKSDEKLSKEEEEEGEEESKITPEQAKKIKRRSSIYFIMLLISTMLYKFSYESFSTGISLIMLDRLDPAYAVTLLGVVTVIYNLSQSVSTSLVNPLLRLCRASTLLACAMLLFGCCVVVILIIEPSTGGSFWTPYNEAELMNMTRLNYVWQSVNVSNPGEVSAKLQELRGSAGNAVIPGWKSLPYLCIGLKIFAGMCYGMIEVLRKFMVPIVIMSSSPKGLKRMNALVHICYEIAGTTGAIIGGFIVNLLGPAYCLMHLPLAFLLAATIVFFIWHDFDGYLFPSGGKKKKKEGKEIEEKAKKSILEKLFTPIKEYFLSLWVGCKTILFGKNYFWLLVVMVFPQVFHRVKESLIVPLYAKKVVKDKGYAGILNGGSNAGELVGALVILLLTFAKKIKIHPMIFCELGALSLNLLWIYPWLPWNTFNPQVTVVMKILMACVMACVSCGYAAGDISMLSYIGSSIQDKKKLGSAMSFIYIMYVFMMTAMCVGVGQLTERFGDDMLAVSLSIVIGIFTLMSVIILVFSLFGWFCFRKDPREEKAKELWGSVRAYVNFKFMNHAFMHHKYADFVEAE